MLTLQELKRLTAIPAQEVKAPTARRLRETGEIVVEKQFGRDTRILVYRNGYALYHAGGHSTVFPIHICGDYLYASSGISSYLPQHFFEKESWHVRLVLEGEDRLDRNQRAKEQERTVSYSAISEEWQAMMDMKEEPLGYFADREIMGIFLRCLTERQRLAVNLYIFQQKTQKEVARELGITSPAVSAILSQAFRRLRKKYPDRKQAERAVADI